MQMSGFRCATFFATPAASAESTTARTSLQAGASSATLRKNGPLKIIPVLSDRRPPSGLPRRAWRRLTCEAQLDIAPGATHLFGELGTLEIVVERAANWLLQHIPAEMARRDCGDA